MDGELLSVLYLECGFILSCSSLLIPYGVDWLLGSCFRVRGSSKSLLWSGFSSILHLQKCDITESGPPLQFYSPSCPMDISPQVTLSLSNEILSFYTHECCFLWHASVLESWATLILWRDQIFWEKKILFMCSFVFLSIWLLLNVFSKPRIISNH